MRTKIEHEDGAQGSYFTGKKDVALFSSGCTVLDEALGGGFPEGRMSNIIGFQASGKSLLAVEALANFKAKHAKGQIFYVESESAFDKGYAEALGIPIESVVFASDNDLGVDDATETVEGLFEYINIITEDNMKAKVPTLIIVDSLDAFSDREEKARDIDKGSFGANKAKKMSELFRRNVTAFERACITLIIVSQVRDNIGVTFGKKTTRSGGRALDFYASIIMELVEVGKIKKVSREVERVIGVKVKCKITKNKVGLPFREAAYPIYFGYGIDDVAACATWLKTVKCFPFKELGVKDTAIGMNSFINKTRDLQDNTEHKRVTDLLIATVRTEWRKIEEGFLPKRRKY